MSFSEIIGQDRAVKILQNTQKYGKIAHSYIFAGPVSSGKKMIALEFAKLLNCQNPNENGACDKCISCKKINNQNHPEVNVYKPEKSNISIEVIRDIQRTLQFRKAEANYRVLIIEDADKMNKEASNCFLKTLEEPPEWTIIILITNTLTNILKTIYSRCQIVKFKKLTFDEKFQIIKQKTEFSDTEINQALSLSSGNLKDTFEILNNEDFNAILNEFNELYEDLFIKNNFGFKLQKNLDLITKDKEKFSSFLTFSLNKVELEKFNQNFEPTKQEEKIRLLLKSQKYLERNVHPKLIANWLYLRNM